MSKIEEEHDMTEVMTEVEGIDIEKMDEQITEDLKSNITLAIQTEVLKKLVGKVERSVSKRTVQEIFKFIFIQIEDNKLTLRGINSDYLTEAIAIKNEDGSNFRITGGTAPTSICFPADKLVPIVKRLNAKNTEIKIEANVATIKCGRPKFNLNGVDGDEFPRTPSLGDSIATVSVHPSVLSTMYDNTIYAASTKETRPILTGVHHVLKDSKLRCVATDSHRLGQYVYDLDEEQAEVVATIPNIVLAEAKKHVDATEVEVQIHFYENQVVYEYEDVTLYARVLEGNYPDTNRLIFSAQQAGASFVVHAGNFKNLLNNSTVYNPDQPILIRIKPELNQLRVNTREAEVGAFQEDLAITEGTGEDVVVAVNVRYLQEAFSRYNNDDYVKCEFMPSTESRPAGLQPFKGRLHNGNEECLQLFVPVRTDQVDYSAEIVIDNFQGVPEFEFNPFEDDFKEVE